MSSLAYFVFLCILATGYSGMGYCPEVHTESEFDVHRYHGDWYEIYSFPTPYEKGDCARATYTMKDDGHIEVYNRYIKNGQEISIVGDAFAPDANEPGKMVIGFTNGTHPGNYWVLKTDYDNYSLVYSCRPVGEMGYVDYAWIIARNMTIGYLETLYLKMDFASYYIDVTRFTMTNQTDCPL